MKDGFFTGLSLLGFKPIKSLKLHLYVSPGSFIYPDEDLIRGISKYPRKKFIYCLCTSNFSEIRSRWNSMIVLCSIHVNLHVDNDPLTL